MAASVPLRVGQTLKGPLFHEPMRVETVAPSGDGAWVVEKISTQRMPRTVEFRIGGAKLELYKAVPRFVKRHSARAAAAGDDRRAGVQGRLAQAEARHEEL